MSAPEKIVRGRLAIDALAEYKAAKKAGDLVKLSEAQLILDENFKYFGYGYFENNPQGLLPNLPLTFYSFHVMVMLGFWFLVFFALILLLIYKNRISTSRFWLKIAIINIPLAYIASQSGWITAEMGRQPWVIQDLMPTMAAVTKISTSAVQVTFWLFAIIFTTLLIAEIKIMTRQIKIGPKSEGGTTHV
jgi:cytochrome d ubiquinol oxidase subunit I